MDIQTIAEVIIMTNNQRLDGTITREQHAIMIHQFDDLLSANGYSWDDIVEVTA